MHGSLEGQCGILFEVLGMVEEVYFDAVTDSTVVVIPVITGIFGNFIWTCMKIYFISYMLLIANE